MNTELVDYGIQSEESDVRAHVCVVVRRVYVYPTIEGLNCIRNGNYPIAPAFQKGIKTAEGYLVPPKEIKKIREVEPPKLIWGRAQFNEKLNESEKGNRAVYVIRWLLMQARFPMFCDPELVRNMDLQIKGTDLYINADYKIQVKCDYRGGPRQYGGTGNLYLQIKECNPFGMV